GGPDRLLLRLQRLPRLRRGGLPQSLVLRTRLRVQPDQGRRTSARLRIRPAALRPRGAGAAGAGAGRCAALHADAALRLDQHAGRQPGGEEGPARISAPHALPPAGPLAGRIRTGDGRGMKPSTKTVEIFTDGACSGNPGPGGWGALMRYNGKVK